MKTCDYGPLLLSNRLPGPTVWQNELFLSFYSNEYYQCPRPWVEYDLCTQLNSWQPALYSILNSSRFRCVLLHVRESLWHIRCPTPWTCCSLAKIYSTRKITQCSTPDVWVQTDRQTPHVEYHCVGPLLIHTVRTLIEEVLSKDFKGCGSQIRSVSLPQTC